MIDRAKAIAAIQALPDEAAPSAPGAILDLFRLTGFEIEKVYKRNSTVNSGFALPAGVTITTLHVRAGSIQRNGTRGFVYTPPRDPNVIYDIIAAECTDGLIRADFIMVSG